MIRIILYIYCNLIIFKYRKVLHVNKGYKILTFKSTFLK